MSARVRVGLLAPAKVNLFLKVLHRRDDGFHELQTLFQAISLADEVEVSVGKGDEVTLEVVGPKGAPAPELGPAEENLAVRAAQAFLDATGRSASVRIRLTKHIPAGAGLGGGSSDAAAVLKALQLLGKSPLEAGELSSIGLGLGSDVPFFLQDRTLALATGRGEKLQPRRSLPPIQLTLVTPPVHVATAEAYDALGRDGVESASGEPLDPDSWEDVADMAHNDFQETVAQRHPEVSRSLDALRAAGGRPVLLSGSGAACFAAHVSPAARSQLSRVLDWPVRAVSTLPDFPAPALDTSGGT